MHFHHHTLHQLSQYLITQHQGDEVLSCFSQSRNELIIELSGTYLRIGCNTPDTYVVPVSTFAKARKNVVGLFESVYGLTLENCYAVPQEREMVLTLSQGYSFVLKLHGSMANVLLRKEGDIVALFDHRHDQDWDYVEAAGALNLEALETADGSSRRKLQESLRQVSPIYDKQFAQQVWAYLQAETSFSEALEQVIATALDGRFWLIKETQKIRFSLFPPLDETPSFEVQGVAAALQLWLKCQFQYLHYQQQYKFVRKSLEQPHEKLQKIYQSYSDNVEQLAQQREPEEIGHLIMANLHAIPAESQKASLEDLYQGGMITVKLDPKLSPQANAKRYYDKHKDRRVRLAYLKEQLDDIEMRLLEGEESLTAFQQLVPPEDLTFNEKGFDQEAIKALKQLSKSLWKEQKASEEDKYPFRSFQREGYQIFVGRNARNNDELSFKFAHKNDLWLHAKDVTGSHVIIRQRPGKDMPPTVLEYAAQLAAYYSKRKTDTLVPVQYTPRKYIRKRKGDPPGLVAVDREEVIMVEPIREIGS